MSLSNLLPNVYEGNYMNSSISKTIYNVDSYYKNNENMIYNHNKIFKIYIGFKGNNIFNSSRIIINPYFKNYIKITFNDNSIKEFNIETPIIIFFYSFKKYLEDDIRSHNSLNGSIIDKFPNINKSCLSNKKIISNNIKPNGLQKSVRFIEDSNSDMQENNTHKIFQSNYLEKISYSNKDKKSIYLIVMNYSDDKYYGKITHDDPNIIYTKFFENNNNINNAILKIIGKCSLTDSVSVF